MKRTILLSLSLVMAVAAMAQTHMRLWQNGENNRMKIATLGEMPVADGNITIKGQAYKMSEIDSLVVVPEVRVTFSDGNAEVSMTKNASITHIVDGAHVTLVNNDTSNECEIVLEGSSSDGSLTYIGAYKTTLILNGLNLQSQRGAALDIQCGKRVAVELVQGTTNQLTDAAAGTQKACFYCKGHLEFEGSGSLSIAANTKHGLSCKEYLQLKRSTGTINISKAAADAIHCGQYFMMNGGQITVNEQTMGDAIQVETLTLADGITPDPNEVMNGQIIMRGGTINATLSQEDCKGLKCDDIITISGGNITIAAQGNGTRGIQTDGKVTINEFDNPTVINITATGGKCTLAADVDDPHRCVGMKLDGGLLVEAGSITVTADAAKKARSIQLPVGGYTKTGGTVTASPAITLK
ncbi:MAG: carbohydrate-binding domain-containing protein [Bacteroidales bacterium]|nr:carbohydrate-binding domain-containing protein [Candidatus Physcousia equi]